MATFKLVVNLSWPGSGSPGVNVWHLRGGTAQPSDVDAMVDAVHGFYQHLHDFGGNGTTSIWPAGYTVAASEVVNVDDQSVSPITFAPITTTSGAELPAPVMLVAGWRTSIAARRGMGRTFIGPLNSACDQGDGTPTAATVSAVQDAINTLVNASLTDANGAVVIYGYDVPGGPARVARDITSGKCRDSFAVLRSRRD